MILTWEQNTNIENSVYEFVQSAVATDSLQLLDENGTAQDVNVYIGRTLNNNWKLPLIQLYFDSTPDQNRLEIGTNKRLRSQLIIFEIRTLLPGQETNLGNWLEETINNGIPIYTYVPNSLDTNTPIKTLQGHGRVDFISSLVVPVFDNADVYDKNRYRLSIKLWVNNC